MSRIANKSKNRTAPRNSSPAKDPKFLMIRERINQIASSMKSPLRSYSNSFTPDPVFKENSLKSPINKYKSENSLENFLLEHNLHQYLETFKENQITLQDIPSLTKEDLVDLKLPMGPRKRLISIIENWEESQIEIQPSSKRSEMKEEVNQFISDLNQFSKRSFNRVRPSSRNLSLEASFDAALEEQRAYDNIAAMIRDINEKQNYMIKAIEESQKAIMVLRKQLANNRNRCTCNEYR